MIISKYQEAGAEVGHPLQHKASSEMGSYRSSSLDEVCLTFPNVLTWADIMEIQDHLDKAKGLRRIPSLKYVYRCMDLPFPRSQDQTVARVCEEGVTKWYILRFFMAYYSYKMAAARRQRTKKAIMPPTNILSTSSAKDQDCLVVFVIKIDWKKVNAAANDWVDLILKFPIVIRVYVPPVDRMALATVDFLRQDWWSLSMFAFQFWSYIWKAFSKFILAGIEHQQKQDIPITIEYRAPPVERMALTTIDFTKEKYWSLSYLGFVWWYNAGEKLHIDVDALMGKQYYPVSVYIPLKQEWGLLIKEFRMVEYVQGSPVDIKVEIFRVREIDCVADFAVAKFFLERQQAHILRQHYHRLYDVARAFKKCFLRNLHALCHYHFPGQSLEDILRELEKWEQPPPDNVPTEGEQVFLDDVMADIMGDIVGPDRIQKHPNDPLNGMPDINANTMGTEEPPDEPLDTLSWVGPDDDDEEEEEEQPPIEEEEQPPIEETQNILSFAVTNDIDILLEESKNTLSFEVTNDIDILLEEAKDIEDEVSSMLALLSRLAKPSLENLQLCPVTIVSGAEIVAEKDSVEDTMDSAQTVFAIDYTWANVAALNWVEYCQQFPITIYVHVPPVERMALTTIDFLAQKWWTLSWYAFIWWYQCKKIDKDIRALMEIHQKQQFPTTIHEHVPPVNTMALPTIGKDVNIHMLALMAIGKDVHVLTRPEQFRTTISVHVDMMALATISKDVPALMGIDQKQDIEDHVFYMKCLFLKPLLDVILRWLDNYKIVSLVRNDWPYDAAIKQVGINLKFPIVIRVYVPPVYRMDVTTIAFLKQKFFYLSMYAFLYWSAYWKAFVKLLLAYIGSYKKQIKPQPIKFIGWKCCQVCHRHQRPSAKNKPVGWKCPCPHCQRHRKRYVAPVRRSYKVNNQESITWAEFVDIIDSVSETKPVEDDVFYMEGLSPKPSSDEVLRWLDDATSWVNLKIDPLHEAMCLDNDVSYMKGLSLKPSIEEVYVWMGNFVSWADMEIDPVHEAICIENDVHYMEGLSLKPSIDEVLGWLDDAMSWVNLKIDPLHEAMCIENDVHYMEGLSLKPSIEEVYVWLGIDVEPDVMDVEYREDEVEDLSLEALLDELQHILDDYKTNVPVSIGRNVAAFDRVKIGEDYKITIPVSIGRKVAAFDQGDFNEDYKITFPAFIDMENPFDVVIDQVGSSKGLSFELSIDEIHQLLDGHEITVRVSIDLEWPNDAALGQAGFSEDNKTTVPVFIDMEWLYDALDHVGSSEHYKITVPVSIDIEWAHVAAIDHVGVNQAKEDKKQTVIVQLGQEWIISIKLDGHGPTAQQRTRNDQEYSWSRYQQQTGSRYQPQDESRNFKFKTRRPGRRDIWWMMRRQYLQLRISLLDVKPPHLNFLIRFINPLWRTRLKS